MTSKTAQIRVSLTGARQGASETKSLSSALDRLRRTTLATGKAGTVAGGGMGAFGQRLLSVDAQSGRLSRSLGLTNRALSGARTGAYAAAAGMAALAVAGVKAGFDFNNAVDRQAISFKTLLGSQEKAASMQRELGKLADRSPVLDVRSAGAAATALLSYGIAAKDTTKYVDALANMTVVSGGSIAETLPLAARALGQIQGKGKLSMEELNQLTEGAALNTTKLAKNLGMTRAELDETFKPGKQIKADVALPAILKTMQESGGKAAAEYSKTFAGRLDALKDQSAKAAGGLVRPLQDRLTPLLSKLSAGMAAGAKGADTGGAAGFVAGFDGAVGASGRLVGAYDRVVAAGASVAAIFRDSVAPAAKTVWGVVSMLPNPLTVVADVLALLARNSATLKPILVGLVGAYVLYRVTMLAVIAAQTAYAVATRAAAVATGIYRTAVLMPIILAVARYRVALVAQAVATRATTVATRGMAVAQGLLNLAMRMNPIGRVITALVAVGAGFVLAYNKIGWFRDGVNAVWSWIKGHWPLILSILTGPVGAAVIFIVRNWDKVKSAASSVVSFVRGKFDALVGFFKGLPGKIAGAVSGMWEGLKSGFVSVINWIIDKINWVIGKIPDIAGSRPDKIQPIGGGSPPPAQASGGVMTRSGLSWVGERGPELVSLPVGATTFPARASAAAVGAARGLRPGDYAPLRAASARPHSLAVAGEDGSGMTLAAEIHTHVHIGGREVREEINRVDVQLAGRD